MEVTKNRGKTLRVQQYEPPTDPSSSSSYPYSPRFNFSNPNDDTRHFGPRTPPPPSVPELKSPVPGGPYSGRLEYHDFQLGRLELRQKAYAVELPEILGKGTESRNESCNVVLMAQFVARIAMGGWLYT